MKTQMQMTSLFAYYDIKNLGAKQRAVYNIIEGGPVCNLDIAERLGVPINQVTGRTNELVAKNLVEEAFKAPSKQTGRQAIYWRIKNA